MHGVSEWVSDKASYREALLLKKWIAKTKIYLIYTFRKNVTMALSAEGVYNNIIYVR